MVKLETKGDKTENRVLVSVEAAAAAAAKAKAKAKCQLQLELASGVPLQSASFQQSPAPLSSVPLWATQHFNLYMKLHARMLRLRLSGSQIAFKMTIPCSQ